MTLATSTARADYTGNGATSTYSFSFLVSDPANLLVTVRNTSNVETALAYLTDFTASGIGAASGGSITLMAGALASGYHLTIRRVVPLTQGTDVRNQGQFYPEIHESEFDYLTMIDQQQQDAIDRSAKLPETIRASDFNPTLPETIGQADATLAIDSTGKAFSLGPSAATVAGNVSSAAASATAAGASAAAASTSQTAAAGSATAAAGSATAAAGSASAASGSATAAAASAASAAGAVLGTLLTGFASTTGTLSAADTVLGAIDKLAGNDAAKLPLAGGTMAGPIAMGGSKITGAGDPTAAQDVATMNWVQLMLAALDPATAVYAASTANIPATYANGAAGVGATLTVTATGAFSIDGVSPPQGSRILIKNQTAGLQNGVYDLTTAGSTGVSPVLTRSADYNSAASMNGAGLVPVRNGSVNSLSSWQQNSTITTVGTDALVFTNFTQNPALYPLKANNLSDIASKTTAFDNLSPVTTKADLITYDGTHNVRSAVGADGTVLTADSAQTTGMKWAAVASAPTHVDDRTNLGLSASVATNLLTVALKQSDGATNPSAGSPVQISFRSATATTGAYNTRSVTAALSVSTVATGASLGLASGQNQYTYVYALDNAGAVELALSGSRNIDEGSLQNTTAIGAGSTNSSVLYSTAARTSVPVRLVGRIQVNEATSGTYASAPSEVAVWSSDTYTRAIAMQAYGTATGTIGNTLASSTPMVLPSVTFDTTGSYNSSTGEYTAPVPGQYQVAAWVNLNGTYSVNSTNTSQVYVNGSAVGSKTSAYSASGVVGLLTGTTQIVDVKAGDKITVRMSTNATSPSFEASGGLLSIRKV